MKILVTGGAGFIGSNLIRQLIDETDHDVVNLDKLTYAGNLTSLEDYVDHERYSFVQVDLNDPTALREIFQTHQPDAVMHLAAESHVDRSIDSPGNFIHTNILGTYHLLQAAREHWSEKFRFCLFFLDLWRQPQGAVCRRGFDRADDLPERVDQAGWRAAVFELLPPLRHLLQVPALFHRLWPTPTPGLGDRKVHCGDYGGESD